MHARRVVLAVTATVAFVAVGCVPPTPPGPTTTTTTAPVGRPTAIASGSPTIGDAPLTVQFDSSGSLPGTGTGLTYQWNFGDGSSPDATPNPSHLYLNPGTYTARLTLTNSLGSSTSAPIVVTVNVDANPKYYVRVGGGTGSTCGPILNPCASIAEAQTNALATQNIRTIRVAGGNFSGPLDVAGGMSISGGWKNDFSGYGIGVITTINGTGNAAPVRFAGVANSSISAVSIQATTRTSGNAVGVEVSGGSSNITIGDNDAPRTIVAGGVGPQPPATRRAGSRTRQAKRRWLLMANVGATVEAMAERVTEREW